MANELPTGTVTFLFTDIEGSTTLLKTLGSARYHEVLAQHERLLRDAVAHAQGREIDTQGDSFFFAFRRAGDAVAAAIAAQRALAGFAWPDGLAVRVRMGLDTGEPTVGGERYVGLGVHRTARIMAAGHGGQVLLSSTTRDLAEDELPADVALRDLGEQRLKDLDRPVRLYQVAAPGLLDLFPPLRTLDTERAGRGPSRLPRRVLIPVATLVGAAIAVGVVFATRSGGTGGTVVASNSVGLIDPTANKVVGEIGVGIRPGSLAVGAGSVWVGNEEDKTLSHILVATRSVKRSIPLDATPTGVAQADGAVWVAEGPAGALARVDPQFETVVKTIPGLAGAVRVSGPPSGSVTVGDGKVWVAYGSSTVARINPTTNAVAATGFAGRDPVAIAFGAGAVWIANQGDNSVSKFSVTTDSTVAGVSVGQGPSGVAVGGGAVWVSDTDDDAVSRVDPTSRASRTIEVGRGPVGIAYGASAVWVANSKDGTVSRIDPATGKVVKTIKVGGSPVGIAVGGGLVWVTVQGT